MLSPRRPLKGATAGSRASGLGSEGPGGGVREKKLGLLEWPPTSVLL